MRKIISLLLLAVFVGFQALANPAHRGLSQKFQPDGTVLSVQLNGDEYYSFYTTVDDYTVMLNDKGAFVYAKRDGLVLVPTQLLAHDLGQRTDDELRFLALTPRRLVDGSSVEQAHLRRVKRNASMANFNFDNLRGLVILIDFSDKKFASDNPQEFYTEMFNTENLQGFHDPVKDRDVSCPGSVRDYFNDQSNGAFIPPFDVYGPYSTTKRANQCYQQHESIFKAAIRSADADIDFRQYDNDNDGKVDMVFFLVAGLSAAANGVESGYLWPHASTLLYSMLSCDGKGFDRYASSTELYGYESSPSTITVEGIGTVCHEFSHVLGLPDFYDTDYEEGGGRSHHPGAWDIMAGGSDNNNGRHPVGYTFFERYALGWATPKTITEAGSYTLEPVNTSREGYILRTPQENEFFILENRQKTGWDYYLPGHGMIVTRVDSTNTSIWSRNEVNCNPEHNYFEMLRAGNTTKDDLPSDPFPGTLGIPMITNETSPNLCTWAGYANDFNIMGISENNGVVSFTVLQTGTQQTLVEDFEGMQANSSTTDQDVEGVFANWSFYMAGVRAPGEDKANDINSVMMKLPSQFYTTTPIYYNMYMATVYVFNRAAYAAMYTLEYSTDNGQSWKKALCPNGKDFAEMASKSNGLCYWNLDLDNTTPVLFRISMIGGNKNAATYLDDFTIYYTGEEGGPITDIIGDVNDDGEVGIADVNLLISIVLGGEADADTLRRADVNADGEITIADINVLIGIVLDI